MINKDSYKKNSYEAKDSLKRQIIFFETLLKHFNGKDESLKAKSMWATYCLHRYIEDRLIDDVEATIAKHCASNDPN